jgi:cyclic di-GMP phosphodiesterase
MDPAFHRHVGALAEPTNAARPTALIVDDERGPREALRLVLEPEFTVLAVESGEQALAVLRTTVVEVVTLDLKMQGLSGQRTLALIKQAEPNPEVVIVTGYGCFDSAVEALRLRAFDFVHKPFDAGRLLHVAQRAATAYRRRHDGGTSR